MADILRVSTPITTNPSSVKPNTAGAAPIDAAKTEQSTKVSVSANPRDTAPTYDAGSVFQTFANRLVDTPPLSQTLQKLLLGVLTSNGELTSAEASGSVPTLLAELAGKLNMSESEILQNLLFQKDQSTGFSSRFFDVLRDITRGDSSPETTNYIGRFLKSLDSYTTSSQTMKGILMQLNNVIDRIPRSYAENIREMMGGLIMDPDSAGIEENLKLLKESILPMLGKYVSSTNDLGATRDRIELLMHDISRLNLSGKEELTERFTELLDYARYNLNLPADKLEAMQTLFDKVLTDNREYKNEFIDSLAKALTDTGGLSTTGRTMVNDTINALLLNRSVYMPFNHIFLPFMYNGSFMFTEMWVEKDGSGGAKREEDGINRVYLNFDIQGLGKFQAAIGMSGNNTIDCLLNCPEALSSLNEEIENDVSRIFSRNGFEVNSVKASNDSFKIELEVLHRIYEGRSSIDVTV